MEKQSPYRLTLVLCMAEIFGMASISVFPALLPIFLREWKLSHTAAGWISAAYYGGYILSVPFLTGATDRIDARKIMGIGAILGIASALGYAFFAQGFWSAAGFRFLSGIGLAGIYMPGLKIVSDHTEGALQSRFVSFYTASFSIGASLSYLLAGEVYRMADWHLAFIASAGATAVALGILGVLAPPGKIRTGYPTAFFSDLKRAFRSRPTLGYVLGYAAHMWELFSFRAWVVAFLVFCLGFHPGESFFWSPTQIAFLVNLIGLPASILGNELSRRFDRKKVITISMVVSAGIGAGIGFTASLPYLLVVGLVILYGVTVTADSSSLTAGAVSSAPEGFRGSVLAVHSFIGFGAAFLGPLVVGILLDAFHGGRLAWGFGYLIMGAGSLIGPLVLSGFRSDNEKKN
ncbi:MAG: MFS transporter [Thermodesulfobacteriota bacterium]